MDFAEIKAQVAVASVLKDHGITLRRGDRCACPIPGHGHGDDGNPESFHALLSENRWHCHARKVGGDVIDLERALGNHPDLPAAARALAERHGLGGPPRANGRPKPDREHHYHDEAGDLLYRSIRRLGKWWQERYDPATGKWVGGKDCMKGVRLVPYRLPELLARIEAEPGVTVFIAEGERDVDTLWSLGRIATCNVGGAGKWRSEYTEHLRGAGDVIVFPDADEAGRPHGRKVATSTHAGGLPTKVVEMPGGHKDVTDFIAAGGTWEALEAIVRATTAWTPDTRVARRPERTADVTDDPRPAEGVFAVSAGTPAGGMPDFSGKPRPVTEDLPPIPALAPALIPGPLRGWLEDIAARGCFPLEYPAAAALVALGALAGRRLAMRPKKYDDWLVVPNLWGAVVGPPSIQKSPAIDEALLPLKRLVMDAHDEHEKAVGQWKIDSVVAAARKEAAKKKLDAAAKRGASDEDLEALAREVTEDRHADPPTQERILVNDATVEKLGELLRENPIGLLQHRDELSGFLRSLDKQGHENDRGFYLESWNGTGSYTFDRIGRGSIFIPNVCVSIFGGIQPGPLAKYLKAAASGDEADGFMPRFQVMVYPDPPGAFVNIDRYPDADAKNKAYEVFRAIASLDPGAHGTAFNQERGLHYIGFTPDAQDFFDTWRADLENRLRSGLETVLMQCHLGKYRSLMPSLALLFQMIREPLAPVSLVCAEEAAAWCDLLEAHARRIYHAATNGDVTPALILAERLKPLPNPFTYREVAKKGWSGLDSSEDVRRAVGILEDRGWLKVVEKTSSDEKGRGRPSEQVWIHPDLLRPESHP